MTELSGTSLLELRGIVKSFGATRAVDGVSFACLRGEIHGLVGENGAGKSTLMKVAAGVHVPEEGGVFVGGAECKLRSNLDARRVGIGVVYQELSLLPELSVAENIVMGNWPRTKSGLVDWPQARMTSERVLGSIGVDLDPNTLVISLPMAMRQMVEIAKVLSQQPDLIIFDEPTAPLSTEEVSVLFRVFRDLKESGKGVVFISHRIDEVLSISDRITVMKDGRVITTEDTSSFDEEKLISSMVGRHLDEIFPPKQSRPVEGPPLFSFCGTVSRFGRRVAFTVGRGEVVGVGGLQGQGQLELLQSIFGLGGCADLRLSVGGTPISVRNPIQAMRRGIALVPENRNDEGVFLILSVLQNLSAPTIHRRTRIGFIRRRAERGVIDEVVTRLSIRIASLTQSAQSLSGGNMQKLVIGKWLLFDPRVIVLLEPTKGVDVGTKQEIYRLIRSLADRGVAAILNTSDMLELIGVCDRVLIMNQGMLTASLRGPAITEENVMKAAVSRTDLLESGEEQ